MSKVLVDREDFAHELWSAAQLAPGEGISDGVARIAALLAQPAEAEGVEVVAWLLEGGRFYKPSVETTEARADRRIAERKDETVKSPLVRLAALSAVTAERDRLRDQVEALRKDAERYRWLRDQAQKARGEWEIDGQRYGMMLGADQDDVDQAVDALMSAMPAKEA